MKKIQHYAIFSDEDLYQNQINWILKQIDNCKDDSFNDIQKAKSKLDELTMIHLDKALPKKQLQRNLDLAERHLHGYRNTFLSEGGFKRLNTTLKVAKKRLSDKQLGSKKLDVTVSQEVSEKLDSIIAATGQTKTAFIEELILNYDSRVSSDYKEKQLEFNIPK